VEVCKAAHSFCYLFGSINLCHSTLPYPSRNHVSIYYTGNHLSGLSEKRAADSFVKRLSQIDARGVNERARDKHDLARCHATGSFVMEFII